MTDELEKALRRALRPQAAGEEFSARVTARLDTSEWTPATAPAGARAAVTPHRGFALRRAFRSRWLPAALAACIIAGLGLAQLRQHVLNAERANQARAQLLQALSIASRSVNVVRAAVSREENPDS